MLPEPFYKTQNKILVVLPAYLCSVNLEDCRPAECNLDNKLEGTISAEASIAQEECHENKSLGKLFDSNVFRFLLHLDFIHFIIPNSPVLQKSQ